METVESWSTLPPSPRPWELFMEKPKKPDNEPELSFSTIFIFTFFIFITIDALITVALNEFR